MGSKRLQTGRWTGRGYTAAVYAYVITLHSWLRWATLLCALAAIASAYVDDKPLDESPNGARWDSWFMAAVDLQVLFGLVLYFGLSPFMPDALSDMSTAARNPFLRYWMVDHLLLMGVAVVLVRAGRYLALTAQTARARRSRRLWCFSLAIVAMLVAIPWPGQGDARPLFRSWPSN